MIRYTPLLTQKAALDIINTKQYYEAQSTGLGMKFGFEVNDVIERICGLPLVFTVRYKDIRAAKIASFPYMVFYKIRHEDKAVEILRIFNTHRHPFWK